MKLVNISQAKAQLSSLIEAAKLGEQILIMRGSRPAVTLMKVTEEDITFHPEVSIEALNDFEAETMKERKERHKEEGVSDGLQSRSCLWQ